VTKQPTLGFEKLSTDRSHLREWHSTSEWRLYVMTCPAAIVDTDPQRLTGQWVAIFGPPLA